MEIVFPKYDSTCFTNKIIPTVLTTPDNIIELSMATTINVERSYESLISMLNARTSSYKDIYPRSLQRPTSAYKRIWDVIEWCNINCEDKWNYVGDYRTIEDDGVEIAVASVSTFYFASKSDAVKFTLAF